MALATRCPHCQTAFKVANDQLKLHAGLVRCGSCQQTFNAVENLIPADGQKAPATPPPPAAKPGTPATSADTTTPAASNTNTTAASATTATTTAAAAITAPAEPAPTVKPAAEASPVPEIKATARAEQSVITHSPAEPLTPIAATEAVPSAPPVAAKPLATKPGEEVLAAISKAEKEFEAENLDKPKAALSTPTASATVESKTGNPVVTAATAQLPPAAVVKPAPVASAAAIDFDLGDGSLSASTEEVSDADVARAELETRAALMDPPTADWSMNEGKEDAAPTNNDAAPATTTTKVWRHKENTANVEVDATSQAEAESNLSDDEAHKEAYIGAEEAALANQAAISEDSNSDADEDEHRPNFVIQAEKQQRRKRVTTIMLTLMVLLLFPLLLAQSSYIFRSQLAAWLPESKPYLQQACKLLQCQVNLPAQIEQITVESNELQALAPDRNVFLLVMQIQNRSSIVQAWPTVELILNDAKDKAVLQRVFGPDDYLTEKDKLSKGFTAGSDQNIKLYFELPKLKAAGYHVSVFYP
ncbi:zinc-ribbon domain-containing protein [Undibacterium sp. CY18W]|uniref:Zinc-ribbon domain-containing protein n=1 Tax=Undibacterium hunanense TaxID=2762292 RepID=A0ABR6ZPC2_9BURK|nr:DUF3426 domain-containing protein [Undibacterium hunanense]MBC3917649.1 zinc-ribbon domain-containing protein [Undibacterium hunanense]